jgi:hypothetical protein
LVFLNLLTMLVKLPSSYLIPHLTSSFVISEFRSSIGKSKGLTDNILWKSKGSDKKAADVLGIRFDEQKS